MIFKNRRQAGKLLAKKLGVFKNLPAGRQVKDVIVVGITRGGVVVAKETAAILNLKLDLIVVKKIGALNNPELAIGAVAPAKTVFWDKDLCTRLGVSEKEKINSLKIKNQERLKLEKFLRKTNPALKLKNKIVILIDDGVATGSTVLCAQKYFRKQKVSKIILATPVIAKDTLRSVKKYFDDVIILEIPDNFYAIGQFYKDFTQVSDKEVIRILNKN